MRNYKKEVIASTIVEFDEFKENVVKNKTPEEIFQNSHENYLKTKLKEAIVGGADFDEDIYYALYQMRGMILSKLCQDYWLNEERSVRTTGDCLEFIEDYVDINYDRESIMEYLQKKSAKAHKQKSNIEM